MASQRTVALSWEQRQELATHRDHDPRPYVRERCAAVLKIAQGNAPYGVARHGLLKRRQPDTVYGWLTRYQKEGLAGLLAHQQGGNRRRRLRPRAGGSHRAPAAPAAGPGGGGDGE
jgi:winged helix-turn helix protein